MCDGMEWMKHHVLIGGYIQRASDPMCGNSTMTTVMFATLLCHNHFSICLEDNLNFCSPRDPRNTHYAQLCSEVPDTCHEFLALGSNKLKEVCFEAKNKQNNNKKTQKNSK